MFAVVQIGSRILRSAWLTIRSVPCAHAGAASKPSIIDSSSLRMAQVLSQPMTVPSQASCRALFDDGGAGYSGWTMRPLILLLAALLPATAIAQQPDDVAYCNRLADVYERYIGRSDNLPIRPNPGGGLEADVSAAQCRQGN